jgi:hypothetical protein
MTELYPDIDSYVLSNTPDWLDDITEIDQRFWHLRPSLKCIYDAALARMASPWAVFAHCAAKALAVVPPHVTLPPIIGGKGSLNWFALVIDSSGGGKGAAAATAAELTEHRCATVPVRNLGSGEGIIDAYRVPGDKRTGEPATWRQSVHFNADEIDGFTAQAGRSGSTLGPWLRSAFFAEQLGATTIRSGGEHLGRHSYRLVLTMSAQPTRCAGLLAEQGGGTPQRFMWFPACDPRILAAKQDSRPLAGLDLPDALEWPHPTVLTIPEDARQAIIASRELRGGGHIDPDRDRAGGHHLFVREKLAYALAVLDGRTEMNQEDWILSSDAAEVSLTTREYVEHEVRRAAKVEAAERGTLQAHTAIARSEGTHMLESAEVTRIGRRVVRYVNDEPGINRHRLIPKFNSRDRAWFERAIQACMGSALIGVDAEGGFVPGDRL